MFTVLTYLNEQGGGPTVTTDNDLNKYQNNIFSHVAYLRSVFDEFLKKQEYLRVRFFL